MDKESLERIRQMTKDRITIANFQNDEGMKENKNNKIYSIRKIAVVACCMLILTTGAVFAKEIMKYFFGNEILDKAAESGYVGEINSDVVEEETILENNNTGIVIDDVDVSVKFNEFIMDDFTLSTNMTIEFDEKIKEVFDLDKLQFIAIEDLIVIDNEDIILFSSASKPDFDRLCKKYNLNHTFAVWDEKQYNCSHSRNLLSHDKERNIVNYNITANPADKLFPKSKELTFIFSKIKLEKYEEYNGQDIENGEYLKSEAITLTGDWNFKFEVPEKMYNRTNIEYKVISVSNKDFEVYEASVSDTGFAFGTIISNVEGEPFEYKFNEINKQFQAGQITLEECQKRTQEIFDSEEFKKYEENAPKEDGILKMNNKEYIKTFDYSVNEQIIDNITHITNSKGKKFMVSNLFYKEEFIDKDKYDFFNTFEMSKSDATDKLTVTIIYNGEPVYIELEKVK